MNADKKNQNDAGELVLAGRVTGCGITRRLFHAAGDLAAAQRTTVRASVSPVEEFTTMPSSAHRESCAASQSGTRQTIAAGWRITNIAVRGAAILGCSRLQAALSAAHELARADSTAGCSQEWLPHSSSSTTLVSWRLPDTGGRSRSSSRWGW